MMETFTTYLAMGGYAGFIWSAYGVAGLVLVVFAIDSWRRVKRAEAALRTLEAEPAPPQRHAASDRQVIGS